MKNLIIFFIIFFLYFLINANSLPDTEKKDVENSVEKSLEKSNENVLISNDDSKNIIKDFNPVTNIYNIDIHNIKIKEFHSHNVIPFGGIDLVVGSSSKFESQGINFGISYTNSKVVKEKIEISLINSFSNLFGIDNYFCLLFYPLKEKKLEIGNSINFFLSTPNYFLYYDYSNKSNFVAKMFDRLSMDFNDTNKIGFYYNFNILYRLPFNLKTNTFFYIKYFYIFDKIIDNTIYPPVIKNINNSDFSIGIKEIFSFDLRKREKPYLTGNLLSLTFLVDFPVVNKENNFIPDFSIFLTDIFQKNIYKYITYRFKGVIGYNFNSNENLSGYNLVRGLANGAFTGFLYFYTNNELLLPVFNVDLYKVADVELKSKMDWTVFLAIFMDGGVSLTNVNKKIKNYDFDFKSDYQKNKKLYLTDEIYLNYAITLGGGLRFHPHKNNFIVKLDIGANLLEAIIEEKSPSIEIIISFSDIF